MISLRVIYFSAVSFCLILLYSSCRHQVDPLNGNETGSSGSGQGGSIVPCDPSKIYFSQQVLPILNSNCAMSGCHDDASHQESVVLTSYEKVMNTAEVRPGRAGDSKLYKVIIDNDPDDRMPRPPQNPLTAQQIEIIYQWIQQGAQNLVCQSLCDTNSFIYSGPIRTMLNNKCQGCHSGVNAQGGIDFSTYAGLKVKVDDGKLWGAINHQPGFSAMPKNGTKLSDCEITQVKKWMEAGAPNN